MSATRITSAYAAPRWLPGGHAQTIYAYYCAPVHGSVTRRELWHTPDGDVIDVDCIDGPPTAPLLVMFHGLEGSARSHYARAMLYAAQQAGWRMLLPHFRGCGKTPNRLPRAYHAADSDEADWILRRAHELAQGAPLYAMGISLGGNVLLKWLGERGEAASFVRAAAAVSAPLDMHAAGSALERGFNMMYTRKFMGTLIAKSMDMLQRHPGLFDKQRVRLTRTLREFDDVVTAPLHGFADAADYWTRASSKPLLPAIRVPTLVLNALNDPFMQADALPTESQASATVTLEYPKEGGHVGFVTGSFPGHLNWLPARIMTYLQTSESS